MTAATRFTTVSRVLTRHAEERPGAAALLARGHEYTYEELCREVRAFGHGLAGLGVRQGAAVGLLCTNRAEWVVAALGTMAAGGGVAAFNTWSKR